MGSWMTQPARIVKRNNLVIPTLQIHPWRLGWGGCRVDQVDIATIHARVTNQHVDPCRTPPWVHLTLLIINNTLVTAPTPCDGARGDSKKNKKERVKFSVN